MTFDIAFALGGACLASGDRKQASRYYEQAANLNDRCVFCFRQIAGIAEQDGEKEKSLSLLIKAKLLEPENPEILFDFGRLCLQNSLVRDALPALEKAVQLRPGDDRFAYALAAAYVGRNRKDEAIGLLDRLVKKHPDDPTMNFAMGAALHIAGTDLDGAESFLRKSIRLKPDQLGAYSILGMVVFKKGDEDQAAQIFQDLLQRAPDHLPSLEQLGTIPVKQRKYDEARQVLEKVLRLEPNSLTGHYQYSLLLGRLGEPEESARHREIAQKLEAEERTKARTELILLNPH